MGIAARNSYLESRILSATPIELVQILYEAALEAVESARRHLREGDIAARSKDISRGSVILQELALSVKHDTGPALSRNLVELYDYMQRRLIEANFHQIEGPLAEVSKLLSTLLEGWAGCQPLPAPVPDEIPFTLPQESAEYVRQSWTA
jgi:flagellar protein FliS